MESLTSTFLLLLAAIVALLTYVVVPFVPVVTLVSAAAIALAAGVWWHWTQFSTDYRTSTWQEQLRSYASYAMLLAVILVSYAFYAFTMAGGSVQDIATSARNVSRQAISQVSSGLSRAATAVTNVGSAVGAPVAAAANTGSNRNRNSLNFDLGL
jgi:hypothetical protein